MNEQYKGMYYGILCKDENDLNIDETHIIAGFMYGRKFIGGFISEQMARVALAYYISDRFDKEKYRSVISSILQTGEYYSYKVFVERASRIKGNTWSNIALDEYFDESTNQVEAHTVRASACENMYAIPFHLFSNELVPGRCSVPDSDEEVARVHEVIDGFDEDDDE